MPATSTISLSKAEKSYIQTGILSDPPFRADGRSLRAYRSVELETGVALLANGSARVSIGREGINSGGGTEVIAASKLEVEDLNEDGVEGGRIVCTVSCSPAAYPHLTSNALDELQEDISTILHQTLAHHSLHPNNLGILPGKKSWLLHLDLIVLSDAGNVFDAIFMSARAALWDTRVPRTRRITYRARKDHAEGQYHIDADENFSGFDTRRLAKATDFELSDYWDEGEVLDGRERWPVCVTLNVISQTHYLDATLQEEAATLLRLLLVYSFPPNSPPSLCGMRLVGGEDSALPDIKDFIKEGEQYAQELFISLDAKLREEDLRRKQKAYTKFARSR
ncbi:hypothetical protein AMATHDRAFT_148241 [Amanita thiersii Skay4041]|uniref:Ribosomal RNA-processing protein 42 n=1 Tax=Amanita thiersii Skay4041 TaxID=703135 RepID=A0A2A9NN92_9AGAR|nr:hypothetical protein AMATHDRAFT_148241 [Amanita thiersii Skay4041]